MFFQTYRYSDLSRALHQLSERLRLNTSTQKDRKRPSFYPLQILDGLRELPLKVYFDPLIVPDLNIGPPTEGSISRLREHITKQLEAIPVRPKQDPACEIPDDN